MDRTGLILCRYGMEHRDTMLMWQDQYRLLDQLKDAPRIAFRNRDPGPKDFDTYIIRPRTKEIDGYFCIVVDVARDVQVREVIVTDRDSQTVTARFEDTEEAEIAHVVMIPELAAMAVEDHSGGRLSGMSAARRLQAIVQTRQGFSMDVSQAGGPKDLQKAIRTWDVDQFSFHARPFNPHPSNPGEMLSDLMSQDEIGVFRGVAIPKSGKSIHPHEDGLVRETLGLADKGYATYGVRGRTPSGADAVVEKPPFSEDRQKNLERMEGPQKLRIYVEAEDEDERDEKTVRVVAEFFASLGTDDDLV